MPSFLKPSYNLCFTLDGSPTLEVTSVGKKESMHNQSGAWGETLHVYEAALKKLFEKNLSDTVVRVASVGLGLAYNEMMTIGYLVSQKRSFYIESFESEISFVDNFVSWLNGHSDAIYNDIYNNICATVENFYKLQAGTLRQKLFESVGKNLVFRGALERNSDFKTKYNLIYYDAFSKAVNPDLWSEDFLNYFLSNAPAENCVFSTYAAFGDLKRVLKKQKFDILKTTGFGAKRESTLAYRNLEKY